MCSVVRLDHVDDDKMMGIKTLYDQLGGLERRGFFKYCRARNICYPSS